VSAIDVSAYVINPNVLNRESCSDIEFSHNCLPRPDSKARLGYSLPQRNQKMVSVSIHFKTKPTLPVAVFKGDVASGKVYDLHRGHDRFVRHVLEPLES